jgi:2,3-dihydro-2,3-dihydroxybenzoate dehydrogenase
MQLSGLAGKVAIVTGAAQGIGEGVARALAQSGTKLLLTDRNREAIDALADDLAGVTSAVSVAAELSDTGQVVSIADRCVEVYGQVDFLVNVAGIFRAAPVLELGVSDFDLVYDVNVRAPFLLTQACARHMADRRSGSVVTVSSNAGLLPRVQQAAYCASKAAVSHLMRCFGLELAQYGIRVNTVSPGAADTPMAQQLRSTMKPGEVDEAVAGSLEKFRNGIPLGRLAPVELVASTILFLLSDQSGHITLQDIVVDGGGALGR